MAGAAARTRRVGAMSGGPERRADLQAQPAARSAAWPGGEISSSAMVSRGGGHSRSMPPAVDRFAADADGSDIFGIRSEEHTSELQSLMRILYAVFFLTISNSPFLVFL